MKSAGYISALREKLEFQHFQKCRKYILALLDDSYPGVRSAGQYRGFLAGQYPTPIGTGQDRITGEKSKMKK
jgi:hypothetical protein